MTTPNTADWNAEVNESVNTQKSDENIYSKLVRKFTSAQLKNKKKRAWFVNKINSDWELTPELLEQIRDFAGTDTDFDGLSIEANNITYSALQRQVASYSVSLNNNKQQLKTLFLNENEISPDAYEKKIAKKVDALEETDLNNLLVKWVERSKFLTKIYGKWKTPDVRDAFELLEWFNAGKRYQKLSEDEKLLVKTVDNKFTTWSKLNSADIVTLFETSIFTDAEKTEILRIFVPTMTLQKTIDLGIYTEKDALNYKRWLAQDVSARWKTDLDLLVSNMKNGDIKIPTYNLLKSPKNIDKIIDDGTSLDWFVDDYNAITDEVEASERGIKTLKDFQWELARYPWKVNNPGAFKQWATIEIKSVRKTESWTEDIVMYGKILKAWDTWEIKLLDRWTGQYSTNSDTVTTENYDHLIDTIVKWNPKLSLETMAFNVMSEADLQDKIFLWEIDEEASDRIEQRDPNEVKSRRDDLQKQYNKRKQVLEKEWKTQEEIENDGEIKDIVAKQRAQSAILDKVGDFNHASLLREIDEIDPKWKKYGIKDGISFKVGKWKQKDAVYSITTVNESRSTLHIISPAGDQDMSFQDFYRNFKQWECTRISDAINFQDIISWINTDWSDDLKSGWSWFELDGWSIKKKDSKTKVEYDFLASSKWAKWDADKLVQIHNQNGWLMTISFGTLKSAKKEKKDVYDDKKGKFVDQKAEPEKFTMYDKKEVVTAGWLDNYIRENGLVPRWLDDAREESNEVMPAELQQKFNPWSFLWKGLNIATVAASGKVFYEWLENFFQEWRDERAARFAYAWWKHLLPKDMQTDLMSRIEDAQKKRMDDYLERLKKIASSAAVKLIDTWLHDPHVKQEKHEAAVEFMLSKYGTLCAKWPLYKHKWKFIWYQALGWKVGDKLYNEVKAENEAENVQFSEEDLVRKLIIKQCKPGWFNGIERRSKWYKSLKKIRSTGKSEEIDTWRNDGADERTIKSRISWGMSEIRSGNYPTAIGWFEKVIEKGGSMKDMNQLSFVMSFSWAVYNFDAKVTNDALKKFNSTWKLIAMTRFMSYTSEMDLLNDTILEICKSLWKRWGKYAGITERAQKLHDNLKVPNSDWEILKVEQAAAFYADFWEEITNAMYSLNTGKTNSDGVWWDRTINKMILLEKDDHMDASGKIVKWNKTFQKYYEKLWDLMEDDAKFDEPDFMTDAFKHAGTSWMATNKAVRSTLEFSSANSFRHGDTGKFMWEEIKHELLAIPQDNHLSTHQKEFLVKDLLRWFISGLISKGIRDETLKWLNDSRSPMSILSRWWMYLYDDIKEAKLDEQAFITKDSRAESLLDRYASNIMDGWDHSIWGYQEWISWLRIWESIRETADDVVNRLSKPKQNNTVSKKVTETLENEYEDA